MIAAIVLAAGASRRFGSQKLLARVSDRALVRVVVEQTLACNVDHVLVVLGREAEEVREALLDLPIEFALNGAWEQGMSTSLRCGVAALPSAAEAAMVVLGDQPLPGSVVQDRLIEVFRATSAAIVAPEYQGTRGNPVLFGRSVFPELLRVSGDRGARGVIESDAGRVQIVRFPFPPPADIDTPEDLERLHPSP
jgi:molybdenum cofactor cytidylyltransferase